MLRLRNKPYAVYLLQGRFRPDVLAWKKGKKPLPKPIFESACKALETYFRGFDLITVPAPSFHGYDSYPIWDLVRDIGRRNGFGPVILFPERSGKTRKHWSAWRQKAVQDIRVDPGKFVLLVDDIYTTGQTMRVSIEAVLRKGSYACGLALC